MKLRTITGNDVSELAKVYGEVYSEKPYSEKWNKEALERKIKGMLWMRSYVAIENEKIVGFIFFYEYDWSIGKKGYIDELGVLKEFRGRGISSSLMNHAEKDLKKDGAKEVSLNVYTNAKAYKIYKKRGYRKTLIVMLKKKLK